MNSQGRRIFAAREEVGSRSRVGRHTFRVWDQNGKPKVLVEVSYNEGAGNEEFNCLKREFDLGQNLADVGVEYLKHVEPTEEDAGKSHYLIREWVDGKSLKELIEVDRKMFTDSEVLLISDGILDNLERLSEKNPSLIHCNVNPNHVIVDIGENQEIRKVSLIGYENIIRENEPLHEDILGNQIANDFAAPEVAEGVRCLQSDLFSVGMIMHYLKTGNIPRKEDESYEVYDRIRGRMRAVIEKALCIDPGGRYQNAAEMRQEIRRLIENGEAPESPVVEEALKEVGIEGIFSSSDPQDIEVHRAIAERTRTSDLACRLLSSGEITDDEAQRTLVARIRDNDKAALALASGNVTDAGAQNRLASRINDRRFAAQVLASTELASQVQVMLAKKIRDPAGAVKALSSGNVSEEEAQKRLAERIVSSADAAEVLSAVSIRFPIGFLLVSKISTAEHAAKVISSGKILNSQVLQKAVGMLDSYNAVQLLEECENLDSSTQRSVAGMVNYPDKALELILVGKPEDRTAQVILSRLVSEGAAAEALDSKSMGLQAQRILIDRLQSEWDMAQLLMGGRVDSEEAQQDLANKIRSAGSAASVLRSGAALSIDIQMCLAAKLDEQSTLEVLLSGNTAERTQLFLAERLYNWEIAAQRNLPQLDQKQALEVLLCGKITEGTQSFLAEKMHDPQKIEEALMSDTVTSRTARKKLAENAYGDSSYKVLRSGKITDSDEQSILTEKIRDPQEALELLETNDSGAIGLDGEAVASLVAALDEDRILSALINGKINDSDVRVSIADRSTSFVAFLVLVKNQGVVDECFKAALLRRVTDVGNAVVLIERTHPSFIIGRKRYTLKEESRVYLDEADVELLRKKITQEAVEGALLNKYQEEVDEAFLCKYIQDEETAAKLLCSGKVKEELGQMVLVQKIGTPQTAAEVLLSGEVGFGLDDGLAEKIVDEYHALAVLSKIRSPSGAIGVLAGKVNDPVKAAFHLALLDMIPEAVAELEKRITQEAAFEALEEERYRGKVVQILDELVLPSMVENDYKKIQSVLARSIDASERALYLLAYGHVDCEDAIKTLKARLKPQEVAEVHATIEPEKDERLYWRVKERAREAWMNSGILPRSYGALVEILIGSENAEDLKAEVGWVYQNITPKNLLTQGVQEREAQLILAQGIKDPEDALDVLALGKVTDRDAVKVLILEAAGHCHSCGTKQRP